MKILVLGAGRMGHGAVFDLLRNSPQVESVTIADLDAAQTEKIERTFDSAKLRIENLDVGDYSSVRKLMRGHDSAISCVNYWHNLELTKAAIETKTNFCDLGGNNRILEQQIALDAAARRAGISVIPDCGLAPGMVSILAMHGAKRFDRIEEIHIRVGGLPQNPKPPLDYQLVFSVEGLINEYVERARIVRAGKLQQVDSMTELESLEFAGFPALEAFQTSGGTSTLPDTFSGKIKELDYKTIRYKGHCEKFKTLIDLGLCSSEAIAVNSMKIKPRKVLAALLERYLPANEPDCVLIRLDFAGDIDGEAKRLRYDIIDKFDCATNLSAMMRTTAFPASIIAQTMAAGEVADGAMAQETAIDVDNFVAELARRNINIQESFV